MQNPPSLLAKSSKFIVLTSLATIGLYAVYGSFDPNQSGQQNEAMFTNADSCASNYDPDFCKRSEQDARKQFEETAPRFSTLDECRQQFGSCGVPNYGGENVFLPLMAGFIVGRMINGSPMVTPLSYGLSPNCKMSPMNDPCRRAGVSGGGYFYHGNTFYGSYSGTNTNMTRASAPITVSRAISVSANGVSSARGGFGISAFGHAGGGE
jgi:uncharacterized protein YgiB involved in biofilm formation